MSTAWPFLHWQPTETGMSATSVNNRMSHTVITASAAGEDSFAATVVPRDDSDLVVLPGRRPKGSTLKNKRDAKERERLATFEAARVYKQTLDQQQKLKLSHEWKLKH